MIHGVSAIGEKGRKKFWTLQKATDWLNPGGRIYVFPGVRTEKWTVTEGKEVECYFSQEAKVKAPSNNDQICTIEKNDTAWDLRTKLVNPWFDADGKTGVIGIDINDHFHAEIHGGRVDGCAEGIRLHGVTKWTEGTQIYHTILNACTKGLVFKKEAGSTGSFRDTNLYWLYIRDCEMGIEVPQGCVPYSGQWHVVVLPLAGKTGMLVNGNLGRTKIHFMGETLSDRNNIKFIDLGASADVKNCKLYLFIEIGEGVTGTIPINNPNDVQLHSSWRTQPYTWITHPVTGQINYILRVMKDDLTTEYFLVTVDQNGQVSIGTKNNALNFYDWGIQKRAQLYFKKSVADENYVANVPQADYDAGIRPGLWMEVAGVGKGRILSDLNFLEITAFTGKIKIRADEAETKKVILDKGLIKEFYATTQEAINNA